MAVVNDIFKLSKSRSRPGYFELQYYRGIFVLFAIAYFISYFIYQNQIPLKEFILPRTWLALVPLTLLALSYFFKYIKENISDIAGVFFLAATLHLMGFFYTNDFKTRYELAIITLVLFSNLHLNKIFFVVLYNAIVLSVLEYLFISYSGSALNPFVFFVFVLTVMLICVSYQLYRLRVQSALADKEKLLTDIFNEANDAWFIFDIDSTKAVDTNERALKLFDLDNEDELENVSLTDVIGSETNSSLISLIRKGELSNKEILTKTKKGNDLWLNISLSEIPGSQNLVYCRCINISRERKQKELSEGRALEVRNFLENISDGVVITDDNRNLKLISRNLCELMDSTQQELMTGDTFFNLIQNDLKISDKDFVKIFETKYKSPAGIEMWFRFSGKKIKSPVGNDEDNLWIVQNITTEKQNEVAIVEPLPGITKIFEEGQFGVSLINTDQKILKVNAAFSRMLGYTEKELSYLTLEDISHPEDIIKKNSEIKNVLSGNHDSFRNEKRFIRKDGSVIWTDFTASFLGNKNIEHQAMVMIEDISARKKIEQELRQINSNTTALIENTEDAICSIDYDHNIIVLNVAFIEKFQLENKSQLQKGMNYAEALNGDQKEKWLKLHHRAMKGERIHEEETIITSDGLQKYFETSLHPIFDHDVITGVTYFSRDVTEHKKFEEELLRAKEEAERATIMKSQFLATMSHEIRTPLNGLIGMLDLLKTTSLNQKQEEYVSTIQLSGETLLHIINDILDYSKIESEKMELEAHPFELKKCIDETYDILYYKAQEKSIDLLYNIDSEIQPVIIGDKARLRQVLINLVGNAIKFTDKGQIIISVNKTKQLNDELELEFAVKDTGVGITEDQISRLFKAFSQADVSTFRKFGGTGLGLVISSRLVSLMNGKMWVTSQPGEGSTFYFTIKTKISSEYTSAKAKRNIVYSKYDPNKSAIPKTDDTYEVITDLAQQIPIRILVAEDNAVNQTVIQILLKRLGYDAEIVNDGTEVLRKLSTVKFDLIFMDVQMPELDGIETTERIVKQYSAAERPKIIAMTAFALQGDKEKCLEAGMDDYVSKPIKIEEVQRIIQKWGKEKRVDSILGAETLIDEIALQRIRQLGGTSDTVFLSQVISMFLKQAPAVIHDILENEKNGDMEKMYQAAHKLKGSALNIGAKMLAELCLAIEVKGKSSDLKEIGSLTSQLKNIFGRTEIELRKLI